jgi:hypothetical protein
MTDSVLPRTIAQEDGRLTLMSRMLDPQCSSGWNSSAWPRAGVA